MLTKALSLLLVIFLGLALGLETARYVHAHATGVGVTGATDMVNIHRALLGFSLLATSGALLLSLRADRRGGAGAWLSRRWSSFTAWLELTLDELFDFDALNVGNGSSSISISSSTVRGDVVAGRLLIRKQSDPHLEQVADTRSMLIGHVLAPGLADDGLLPCRGCSWCGVDPGDLPDDLWTECDGSGRYLPSTEAERKRKLAQPKLPLRQAVPRREGKQPDGSYVIEVGPNETHEDVVRRQPDVLFIHQESGDVLVKRVGTGPVIVRPREQ